MANLKIAAIVPAYNEEKTVGQVLKTLLASNVADEVILVDDCSKDNTSEEGRRAGAKVVRLEKNHGEAGAMREGIK